MAWDRTKPTSTTSPCASTVAITSNWSAVEDWWNVEHYTFSSALSGMHKAGIFGAVLTGTNATIEAISSPGTGALCFDTTCGVTRIRRSDDNWDRLTEDHYSRVKLTSTNDTLATGAWTELSMSTETYDSLGEHGITGLLVKAAGYYLVRVHGVFPSNGNYEKAVGVYVAGARYSQAGGYGTRVTFVECVDIVYAAANALIEAYAYNGSGSPIILPSSSLILTRLS